MPSDFLDAHNRHLNDAEQLFNAKRWANADHLYGLATECGLKRLMLAFGMPFDSNRDRPQDQADREHANGIWARYETYRNGHHQGIGYVLPTSNPFQNWNISQRYEHQSSFNQAHVDPHKAGAAQVKLLIDKAKREGLI